MLVIPALDIRPDASRAYTASIAETIGSWEQAGFTRVQLTIASGDRPLFGTTVIEEILRDVQCSVQVAGLFETSEDIDGALSDGAANVILGSRALDELDWLASAAARFPGQLMVASPARERRARTRGALRTLPLDLRDVAAELTGLSIAGLVVQFAADASIGQPELALLEDVTDEVDFPVQFSGSAPDLATLRDLEFRGVAGAVIGAAHLSAAFDGHMIARSFTD